MTPVQATAIAVALDGLRESGFDEATLARMQRAVDGRVEAAVVRFMTSHDDPVPETYPAEWAQVQEHQAATAELREVACLIACPGLSPAEKPSGASTPQPPGETR